jgi:hypothetical protein
MNDRLKSELDIMHGIWREAGRDETGVTIACESEANAKRLRFALYNALKPIKSGKQGADSALLHAIATCSLGFTEDKKGLIIKPKIATVLSKTMLAALAGKEVKNTEDYLMEETFARLSAIKPEPEKEAQLPPTAAMYGARSR